MSALAKTEGDPPAPPVEWAVAGRPLPGQKESGDLHVVAGFTDGVLVGAVDALGHGDDAAIAARTAVAVLERHAGEPVVTLVQRCHEALKGTRGVVMTVASLDTRGNTLTWTGVGNVEGVLLRAPGWAGRPREYVLHRGGVVGYQITTVHADVLPIRRGDVLVFATDGIASGFVEDVDPFVSPPQTADEVLAGHARSSDDALVLVVRYLGGGG